MNEGARVANEKQMLLDIEIDVLSYLLTDSNGLESKFQIVEQLELVDFSSVETRLIYEGCVFVLGKNSYVDLVSVHDWLRGRDGSSEAVVKLLDITVKNYLPEAQNKTAMIRERSRRERFKGLLTVSTMKLEDTPTSEVIADVEQFLFNEAREKTHHISLGETIDALLKDNHEGNTHGYDWMGTLCDLNNATGGIERGKTYILGATKKSGKTRFASAVMASLMKQEVKSLFLSMEMRDREVAKLLLAALVGLDTSDFKREIRVEDEEKIIKIRDFLKDRVVLDTESFLSIEKIRAKVWMGANKGCDVVFLDYLQRMNFGSDKNSNRATVVADSVARIADIARDYNVAVIVLSQLRNQAEDQEVNDMSFLKDSGGIAENADTIISITNKQRQAKGEDKFAWTKIVDFWLTVEQRDGGTDLIKAKAELGRCRFFLESQKTF